MSERYIVFNEIYCDVELIEYFETEKEAREEFERRKNSDLTMDERVILAKIIEVAEK